MVYYITSVASEEVIRRTIKELGAVCSGKECSDEVHLLNYIHLNRNRMKSIKKLIIDTKALRNTEEEIIQALEILKIENNHMQIIVIAQGYQAGNEIIRKCIEMAIYDVIIAESVEDVVAELKYCLTVGKQYKDAIVLKKNMEPEIEKDIMALVKNCAETAINDVVMSDVFDEIYTDLKHCLMIGKQYKDVGKIRNGDDIKIENKRNVLKRTANKILVGISGAQVRIGCSHLCILIANHLRKKGYKVALLEYGTRGVWNLIKETNGTEKTDSDSFTLNEVDYYTNISEQDLNLLVSSNTYNFIIVDFGLYQKSDQLMFSKCDIRMLVTGAKAWETEHIGQIFKETDTKTLKQINYIFNFVSRASQNEVRKEMKGLNHVYFMPLSEDPFVSTYIGDMEEIFDSYELQQPRRKKSIRNLLRKK